MRPCRDNGLAFACRRDTATVKVHGLTHEFVTPYHLEHNGTIERFIRTPEQRMCMSSSL